MAKLINFFETKKALPLLLVLFLTTLVYSNIFTNDFIWDDPDFYANWPALYAFKSLPELLSGHLPPQHAGIFRPLRSVTQLFIVQTFGNIDSPNQQTTKFIYHLISLLIHLVSILAVYLIIELIFEKKLLAFLTALFFGLHPIHTEAITYFTTSIDIIGLIFLLWAIYFYLKSRKLKNNLLYFWSVTFAFLAYFFYEITLILPLFLILIDLFKNNWQISALKEKIKIYLPYWLGLGLWLFFRLTLPVGMRLYSTQNEFNLYDRLFTASKTVFKYLYLLFIPYPLNVYHQITIAENIWEPKVVLTILGIIFLVLTALVLTKKWPIISLAIFWFFLALAPVSNIFPTGMILAEKYAYLSSIASCLVLAYLVFSLLKNENKIIKVSGVIFLLIISLGYGTITYARNFDWKDNETLWQKTLTQRPDYGRVYNNLGFVYYKQKNYDLALQYFQKAKEREPNLAHIYYNLGNVYDELGDYQTAIANYEKVLALGYRFAETYNNLGTIWQKIDNFEKARYYYEEALRRDKNYYLAYSNLGVLDLLAENYPSAQKYFEQALALNDDFGQAHHGLAVSLLNQGKTNEAMTHYKISMKLSPELTDNYNHLAFIYNQQGESEKALEILKNGVTANPNDVELHTNYGILLANNGQYQQAIAELQAALAIDPNYQEAKKVLEQIGQK
ncbi:MAG: hypothetical protein A2912_06095 [Candidatus Buchananbacteria bacterium RIFCSPLOWO2_01_FULL_40_23b]|uniref:Uncharacterized protein n=1 Tax=Candidatus Buchananbacteria bacterium RIFCSPLOWO2_01_FULL_40_23b TaxID=1797544 RepID=A0A1G1YNZ0_9BACT|nr:MAG: hypothetical protein A2912_06095 [Candidatus Buchananbacteria bacterium RIFCSPLOWO2_01_FULL_40_23b]